MAPWYVEGATRGWDVVEEEGWLAPFAAPDEEDEVDAWEARAAARADALAPETRERSVWPRRRTKVGTESTSKDSETSGCDSASTCG